MQPSRSLQLSAVFLSLLLLFGAFRNAHAAGEVDHSFDPGVGLQQSVYSVALQQDGKMVATGAFGSARLNPDGSNDAGFARRKAGYDIGSNSLVLQIDGKALVGHREGVDRLNPDGSLDTTFQVTVVLTEDSAVYALAVQGDGKILIGGNFGGLNGTERHTLARINPDGSLDATFNPTNDMAGVVFALVLQADGKVLVGGRFATAAGEKMVLRLNSDGSRDETFSTDPQTSGVVTALALQADEKLVAGGFFSIGGDQNLTRLNANGSPDPTFNSGATTNNTIFAIRTQSDRKLVIAGGFTEVNGVARRGLARLNPDGTLDTAYNPGADPALHLDQVLIQSLTLQPNGSLILSHLFNHVPELVQNGITRLNEDGIVDGSFNAGRGVNDSVQSVIPEPDGQVLISGDFTAINGEPRNGIARLNHDGSLDAVVFDRALAGNFGPVTAIALQPDEKVLIGTRNGLARVHPNGTVDTAFSVFSGRGISALAVQQDGKILVGGYIVEEFRDPDGGIVTYYRIFLGRRNADGTQDTTFQETIGELTAGVGVADFALQPDGKILVAGSFSTFQAADRFGLARVNPNGALDATFNARANNYVSSLVLQSDGKIFMGGVFTTVSGVSRRRIARVLTDGTLDTSFNPGTGADDFIASIAQQSDGKVVVAGAFTIFNGVTRNRIARLQAEGDLDDSFVPDADERVFAAALQADGNVLLAGVFSTINGVPRPYLARLLGDPTGPSNIAPSVGVSSPPQGAVFVGPANVAILVDASDSDGTVASVDVYANGRHIGSDHAEPFEITWNNVVGGSYSITAVASDNLGATSASIAVGITVSNLAPTVAISSPVTGTSFPTSTAIAILADASDSDGAITRVSILVGETLIGQDDSAPYEVTWMDAPAGSYSIVARATDDSGATTASAPVKITVVAPAPPVPPSDLTAVSRSRTRIDLSWRDMSADELGFKIERSVHGRPFKQIATVGADVTGYSNTGLTPGTKYTYRVSAFSAAGDSPYCSPDTAKTARRPFNR